ncbi:hypothetical protein TNCV_1501501 [Trichonephila clavipes]|uniref:Uncharacterized protein n=1 Tax=Trichonephila clavipes TaxID=2585209 RepID=A0A8X6RT40_TRICX|nr:hypothetical protein TNCV_1501501 [Trichonephila clavipes]
MDSLFNGRWSFGSAVNKPLMTRPPQSRNSLHDDLPYSRGVKTTSMSPSPYFRTTSWCDRDSSVVKITNSWLECHEFEPCTTEEPPCRGAVESPPLRVKWRMEFQLRCHLTEVQIDGFQIATRVQQEISSSWKSPRYMSGVKETIVAWKRRDEIPLAMFRTGHTRARRRVSKSTLLVHIAMRPSCPHLDLP